jgi:hypothetical protein
MRGRQAKGQTPHGGSKLNRKDGLGLKEKQNCCQAHQLNHKGHQHHHPQCQQNMSAKTSSSPSPTPFSS